MQPGPRSPVTEGSSRRGGGPAGPRPMAVPLALLLDAALGEPPACCHPVVLIGRAIGWLERRAPRAPAAALVYGAGLTAVVVGEAGAAGTIFAAMIGRLPAPLDLVA